MTSLSLSIEFHAIKKGVFIMNITRDFSGRLVYGNSDFSLFVTNKEDCSGGYTVNRYDYNACMVSAAVLYPLWDMPVFDSFIKACRFLKKHEKEFL